MSLDWLNLQGQQSISDVVERDRQHMALEHIHSTAGFSHGDDKESGDGEERRTDRKHSKKLQIRLDWLQYMDLQG